MKKSATAKPGPRTSTLIAMGIEIDARGSKPAAAPAKAAAKAAAVTPEYSVDKRGHARREPTNHFTNRAPASSK